MITNSKITEIFTDGACLGNPGKGGWAALLKYGDVTKEISGAEKNTTNNRMEMMAVIQALKALKRPAKVIITTDSQYVAKGVSSWINKWRENNWKTSSKKPGKNVDLWQELDSLMKMHEVKWVWVKGHNGHKENEKCDQMAKIAAQNLKD